MNRPVPFKSVPVSIMREIQKILKSPGQAASASTCRNAGMVEFLIATA